MTRLEKKQKALPILLIMMTTLLGSCKSPPSQCPVPVHANDKVKQWFTDHKPLPPEVRTYLDMIGDEQEALR